MSMNTVRITHRPRRWRVQYVSILVVCVLGLTDRARAQSSGPQRNQNLIEELRRGMLTPAGISRLVELGEVRAIPVLQQQFAVATDNALKAALASALVRFGRRDAEYWDFLADRARLATEVDAPFPIAFDAQGKLLPQQLDGDFIAWARARNLSPEQLSRDQVYTRPAELAFLAVTGDTRGIPLLRAALGSRNYLIQAVAAKGLARLQDTGSISAIIEACAKAPAQVSELIARALVFFDDDRARRAAEMFISNREVLQELRRLSRERGPTGVF